MRLTSPIEPTPDQNEEFHRTARACMAGAVTVFGDKHQMAPISAMVTMLQYAILTLADLDHETTMDYVISFIEAQTETDPQKAAQARTACDDAFDRLYIAAQLNDVVTEGNG